MTSHTKLVFVTAWIHLGPEHTDKTPATRLQHFKRLASSGVSLIVFVSPCHVAAVKKAQIEYPNIMEIRSVDMNDLQTVQIIRTFPTLTLPASLNDRKDTRGFLELMLAKTDFVHEALAFTDATHAAWIDFNVAHVFDESCSALEALQHLQQRNFATPFLAFPVIWGPQRHVHMEELTQRVNWRFAGGFFVGDRGSLEHWYNLCRDALPLFLAETNALVWEVNFWAWLENVFPHSFRPTTYICDHDNSLVAVPE